MLHNSLRLVYRDCFDLSSVRFTLDFFFKVFFHKFIGAPSEIRPEKNFKKKSQGQNVLNSSQNALGKQKKQFQH